MTIREQQSEQGKQVDNKTKPRQCRSSHTKQSAQDLSCDLCLLSETRGSLSCGVSNVVHPSVMPLFWNMRLPRSRVRVAALASRRTHSGQSSPRPTTDLGMARTTRRQLQARVSYEQLRCSRCSDARVGLDSDDRAVARDLGMAIP